MESCGIHIPALFSKEFFAAGFTLIPNLLIKYSTRLPLENMEIQVIAALLYFQQTGHTEFEQEDFVELLHIPEKKIRATLEGMEARGLINVSGKCIDLTGLFEKIADLWAEERVLKQSRQEVATTSNDTKPGRLHNPSLDNLISIFEQEFGRPLSPIECARIVRWSKDEGYSEALILEALQRAVLRAVFNINYIDRILSRWARNNLRTPQEVGQHEEKYLAQRQLQKEKVNYNSTAHNEDKDEKYKDLYINRLGG